MGTLRRYVADHLPGRESILSVYALCVVIVYSWTLAVSFWKVPSWVYYLRVGDLLSIYAYSFLVDFIESILLLSLMLFLSIVLPKKWWKERFVSKSTAVISCLLGSMMVRISAYLDPNLREEFVFGQLKWFLSTLLIIIVACWLFSSTPWLRRGVEMLLERLTVFLYLYLPLTAIALILVVFRFFV